MSLRFIAVTACLAPVLFGQDESGLTARKLYYQQGVAADAAPVAKDPVSSSKPVVKAETKPIPKKTGPVIAKKNSTKPAVDKPPVSDPKPEVVASIPETKPDPAPVRLAENTPDGTPVRKSGLRLGVRYNLLDVDPKGGRPAAEVDSDSVWKAGQCVAVRLEANRGGYLYVLAQGSSGAWQPLLPSPEAASEPLQIRAYSPAPIPRDHCFEISPPAGKERLFIVVSESKEDMAGLEKAIREGGDSKPPPKRRPNSDPSAVILSASLLNDQVDFLRTQLKSRDLKIQKVSHSESSEEPPHSVFIVASDSRPSDRLVVEIEIEHQ